MICLKKLARYRNRPAKRVVKLTILIRVVAEIDQFQKDINDRIDQLRRQIVGKVVSKKENQNGDIRAMLKICEKVTSDINQVKTSLRDNVAAQRDGQVYISMKRAQQIIKSQEIEYAKVGLKSIFSELVFERNRELEKIVLGQMAFGTLIGPQRPGKSQPENLVADFTDPVQYTMNYPKIRKYFECSHWENCKKRVEANIPCVIDFPIQSETDEDSCTITIYVKNEAKLKQAVARIEHTVEKEWITKTVQDQGVHRLNFNHIKEIKAMARNNHVDVTVDTDLGTIVVIGIVANVLEVFDAIHSQLRSANKSFYMKDQAKLMSNIVKWLYLKDQRELPFPDRVNLEIETAFKQTKTQVKVRDRSGEYEIDFGNMTKHDVKQPYTKFHVIRRDLVAGASFDIPKHWQSIKDTENLKLVNLNQQDSEYQKVLYEFSKTLGRQPNIVKIERIQNKALYTQYAAKRKEMDVNSPKQKDNERMLWHGTADYAVQSINSHGFNRSYCGINAIAVGQGVYFAVNANYSDQATYSPPGKDGNKRMYRCLVLTGKSCPGSSDMRVPPPIDKSRPHILYDSVTNNTANPAMFVVFNDTQAYPEHIITYR